MSIDMNLTELLQIQWISPVKFSVIDTHSRMEINL